MDELKQLCPSKQCGGKIYSYVGYKLKLDLCYKCGKFDMIADIDNDNFIDFIQSNPELIPHLIESGYLVRS